MAASEPNPNVEPTVTGQEAWFNEDARFYKDVYVYGNLYYNFDGTDSLNLDELNVSGIATFKDIDITFEFGRMPNYDREYLKTMVIETY